MSMRAADCGPTVLMRRPMAPSSTWTMAKAPLPFRCQYTLSLFTLMRGPR